MKSALFVMFGLTGVIFCCSTRAGTNSVTVPGNANLFAAGYTNAISPAGGGDGVVPALVSFPAANSNQFSFYVSGSISADTITYWTPEGGPYPMNISSYRGISGVKSDASLFLMGVFLTSAPPGTAPSILDFRSVGLGTNFNELSPAIGQSFYIGDGLNPNSGQRQRFNAPANATRLFLGFTDAFGYSGNPGAYGDNSGQLFVDAVGVVIAPPPALSVNLYAGLTVTGAIGSNYLIQYATALAPNLWSNLTNVTLPASPYFILDQTGPAGLARFYRISALP